MKFSELINRSYFLKNTFKNIKDHFKSIEIEGVSNNSKNIKKVRQQTLETLKPSITGSAWDIALDGDDLYWNE